MKREREKKGGNSEFDLQLSKIVFCTSYFTLPQR